MLALASALLAAIVSLPAASSAQTATGQITGTVTDTSGAVMPGVKVVVTNQQTGLTRETTTSDDGDYVVPLLPVGDYVVTAEQAGFKLAVTSDVQLNVDQVQRVDIAAGGRQRHRDGRSAGERARRSTPAAATVGQMITEKQVTDLPLNGRNFLQLLFLGAGAVETDRRAGRHAAGRRQRHQHHGRPADLEQLHDRRHGEHRHVARHAGRDPVGRRHPGVQGADHDLLGRVRLQRQPDQHRQQDRARTRSTASVFGFIRNDGWTRGTSSTTRRAEAPKLDQKQFGFVVGGPVMLPVYDGRNKTFFLVNYEGTRIERGATSFYTVPTPDQLAGRFTTHDHRSGSPASRSRTTPSRSRASRGSRSWRSGTTGFRRRTSTRRAGQLPGGPDASRRTQDQFTIRGDQDLGKLGRVFVRYTKTTLREHGRSAT